MKLETLEKWLVVLAYNITALYGVMLAYNNVMNADYETTQGPLQKAECLAGRKKTGLLNVYVEGKEYSISLGNNACHRHASSLEVGHDVIVRHRENRTLIIELYSDGRSLLTKEWHANGGMFFWLVLIFSANVPLFRFYVLRKKV